MGAESETRDLRERHALLREMTAADVPEIARLEQICFSDAWSTRLLEEMLESPYDEAWVIELAGGELAGYANFRFLSGEGELMRLAVLPAARGRGYARKLMERMDFSASEKNVEELTLEVRAGNEAAVGLYESCGFKAEAIRRGYYRNPDEDAKIMWRRRA